MAAEEIRSSTLGLANLFSVCVECFGLIHGGAKDWDKAQQIELTKLGIEQGRLLAWGDAVGICEVGEDRNVLLDVKDYRDKVEAALQGVIDRPAHTDRITQFDKFGLKPPKKPLFNPEPALDFNRLEAFREKLYYMRERQHDGNPRRGKSATISHWQIVDTARFGQFVTLIKESVDSLIDLFDLRERVDMALKHDIRAFGWHPVFERARAARDLSKLKVVKEVCTQEYPQYVIATDQAMAQLDKEWHDNYDSVMNRRPVGSEVPGAAARMMAKERRQEEQAKKAQRPSWFDSLRSKSWLKHSKEHERSASLSAPVNEDPPRSKSMAEAEQEADDGIMDGLTPARSKSVSAIPIRSNFAHPKEGALHEAEELDTLSQVPTANSFKFTTNLDPVTSMISRNDQYFREHRKSVV